MSRAFLLLALVGCSSERRYQNILEAVEAPGGLMTALEASGTSWSGSAGVDADASMLVGSNTKMFTAAVLLQLVEEGALSLDDSASPWVPQLDELVTVRSLLQHTSGVGEYSQHDTLTADDAAAMQDRWEPDALIALGLEVGHEPPGEIVHYSNTNYIALGLIVEQLEGKALEQVFAERIIEPLGLVRTGLPGDLPDHLAWGSGGAWDRPSLWDPSVGWAAGALYAPTSELARFLQAVMAGELYSEEMLAEQLAPARWDDADDEGVDVSYGLGMMVVDVDGALFYGHQGGLEGFTSLSLYDAESGAVVAVAFNETDVDSVTPAFRAIRIAAKR